MEDMLIVKVNGREITHKDVIIKLKLNGEYRKAATELITEKALLDFAEKNELSAGDTELQEYADKKRKELGLFSVKDTEAYFDHLGVSFEQWADALEVKLITDKVRDKVVGDDVVQQYYDQNKPRFQTVHLAKIVMEEQSEADEIKIQVTEEGEEFSELAEDNSIDEATAAKGGDMGIIKRGVLPADVEARVFAASEGDLIGPVKDGDNWALYRVGEVEAEELTDSLKDEIRDGLFEHWKTGLVNSVKLETT